MKVLSTHLFAPRSDTSNPFYANLFSSDGWFTENVLLNEY